MTAQRRGLLGALVDRLFSWTKGLPTERCTYTFQTIEIPIEPDVRFAAQLYRPVGYTCLGTLIIRTPYGIAFPSSLALARVFAARGYQVLLSSCRGTSGSGGVLAPGRNERADGKAVLVWVREQPWYTGSFATLGGSYLGYTRWALLSDPPPDMKAAVIHTGPHSFYDFIWGTGALNSNVIAWADVQSRMARGDSLPVLMLHLRRLAERLQPVFDSSPLLDAVDKYFSGAPPSWLRQYLMSDEQSADVWNDTEQGVALDRANIPILLTTGWDDLLLPGVMAQYKALTKRGCKAALTAGPWTHLGAQRQSDLTETLTWLDGNLSEIKKSARESPVRIFVTGAAEWRQLPVWPPSTSPYELFLTSKNSLSHDQADATEGSSAFVFDPAGPTPSIGYPLLFDNGPGRAGGDDALATRSDVLVFDTEPLQQDIEICGQPSIHLFHQTRHQHADLHVLLSEVNAQGKSRTISERYLRLPLIRESDALDLSLSDCAHRFRRGTKIRLMVAGGSHPRYIRNLGTVEHPATGSALQTVRHTVVYGTAALSRMVLPVTEDDEAKHRDTSLQS